MKRFLIALALTALLLPAGGALQSGGSFDFVSQAWAVDPDEMLKDPKLEARARDLSEHLRCLVCQNESIDDSNADLAKDLRVLVRERIKAGDTDEQVKKFLVDRYGEFVLLRPVFDWKNLLLWAAPVIVLLIGGIALFMRFRGTGALSESKLSASEERALADILKKY
ncbi:cytochrome c-type biogenesis protein CcmH [Afifella marina DSM 2698]|uniref:Cytochrome c-type biogenesis protein n=1 Tax=Afifella marina DSM 2698 TaxID=1120955 RepID=A0A1G5MIQ5_AFIMA|nr:cytochrome c-type biogenesis protein CcmH [Afifella marina DSM 2698]MBK1628995.1 cytochrome c-type biogenesis protein CcmH [Afifella marina]MBK5916933.1 cytochrome c-type biogenesis protein CcmH [Afifella marina]RAI22775.1 cytochrome c-type biogenesis protein CcmH [Afifella marina DSM 2698]SCZ24389.1 cytochrome c-type biogenesis protein CcmH [Afifella marina DSM 2698]